MKIIHLWQRKSRGVTPVLATVLLIALVIIAGIAVAVVLFGTINAPDPIDMRILSISEFETTDSNIYIDQFSVTLQNTERTPVRIRKGDGFALEFSDGTPIPGWTLNLDQDELFLHGNTILDLPLICDPTVGIELTPENDTIYIEVTVFPKDSTNERSARTFRSDLLSVEDTYGPTFFDTQDSYTAFGAAGLNVSFTLINNGSIDLDLFLEFTTDSDESIFFEINDKNQTIHSFSLPKYSTTNFSADTFTVKPNQATVDDYLVFIILYDNADFEPLSIIILSLTYSG